VGSIIIMATAQKSSSTSFETYNTFYHPDLSMNHSNYEYFYRRDNIIGRSCGSWGGLDSGLPWPATHTTLSKWKKLAFWPRQRIRR